MTLRQILTAALILAAATSAAGQDKGDYYQYVATNPYLELSNASFLNTFQGRIGNIQTDFQKLDGEFISLSESPDSWQAGASTESYYRVGDKLTFYGKMHWQYFEGKDMGAQILMDPEYNPVNFLENSLETKGVKKRETYNLTGGLSYRLGKRLAAGLKLNYTSADQTKIKDPRFSNIWMDIDANAGLSFRFAKKSMVGFSFLYRNTLEQVRGGKYGTTDKQYYIQTDKGGFYGTITELSGDYNHISDQSARPMENNFYGMAAQLVISDNAPSGNSTVIFPVLFWYTVLEKFTLMSFAISSSLVEISLFKSPLESTGLFKKDSPSKPSLNPLFSKISSSKESSCMASDI